MNDTLPPLPKPYGRSWQYDQYGHGRYEPTDDYTADQMREYGKACVAAERERCARIAMEFRRGAGDHVCGQVAAAIMEGEL